MILAVPTGCFFYFTLSSLPTRSAAAFMLAPKVGALVSRQLENFNCSSACSPRGVFFFINIYTSDRLPSLLFFFLSGSPLEHPRGDFKQSQDVGSHRDVKECLLGCFFFFSEFSSCFMGQAAHNFTTYIHINGHFNKLDFPT